MSVHQGVFCALLFYLLTLASGLVDFRDIIYSYLVSFPSKKRLNFLVLVIFSGKTDQKNKLSLTTEEVSQEKNSPTSTGAMSISVTLSFGRTFSLRRSSEGNERTDPEQKQPYLGFA